MLTILNKIDLLKKQLKSVLPLKPEFQNKLDKKFRLEFNYNSNHLEGNTLTYGETELLLIFGQTKGNHEIREYDEMKAHNVAFEMIKEWANDKERPLTEMDIKNLNQVILVEPFWKDAVTPDGQSTKREIKIGNYKEYPNSVRLSNGELFDYTSPSETPIQMGELIQWYRGEEEKKDFHPVTLAAELHYKFVRIHPFDDGNGRISRLLVNYVLLKNDLPPIIIKSSDKKNYLNALRQADAGYVDEFINYIAEQVKWSLELSIKAAKGENIDEPGDLEKKLNQLKKKLNFLEEVKVKKSKEAIAKSFDTLIFPLMDTISTKLTSFKNLFKNQSEYIYFHNPERKFDANTYDHIRIILNRENDLNNVEYIYSLQTLRKGLKKDFVADVKFNIVFHQLVYDIIFPDLDLQISKVYLEEVSHEEQEFIADALGNNLLDKIETAIEE